MDNLETGKDKIKKICEVLKNETLEPAKQEGQRIVEGAHQQANTIVRAAEKKAADILAAAQEKIEKEKQLFKSSLVQACKQGKEALRQDIEEKLFNQELSSWIEKNTADPKTAATLISALVAALEKEGTSADFSAIIPKSLSADKVNVLLTQDILKKLKEKSVVVGDFIGGVQLKLHDQKLTLDLNDQALKELLGQYLRKDFRDILFTT